MAFYLSLQLQKGKKNSKEWEKSKRNAREIFNYKLNEQESEMKS